jgi:hypothetical protein
LFWGLLQKTPQREFPSQNTQLHMTQPIHANSNLIDAAWQAEYDTNLENVKVEI